jgi:heptosyltransferase-1
MRILIVKTTSLGDIIHTFPALTDALKAFPDLTVDWVVEKPFMSVVSWHPAVRRAIPVSVRQWRKNPFSRETLKAVWELIKTLRAEQYDYIIDAQGLIKSAVIARFAQGERIGFDADCARESLASYLYQGKISVDKKAHAVSRIRQLFAMGLGYDPEQSIDYGMSKIPPAQHFSNPTVLLLHGTTWRTKHWPDIYWKQLAKLLNEKNIDVKCVWGNDAEKKRAEFICEGLLHAQVMPKLSLDEVASLIQGVKAAVAVDTGLGHLSEALQIPTISLYGPTDPARTGTVGGREIHLYGNLPCRPCLKTTCSISDMTAPTDPPCLGQITPETVRDILEQTIKGST